MKRRISLMQRAHVSFHIIVKEPRSICKCVLKNKDVVIMEDSTSIGNDLKMHQSRKNEGSMFVVVDNFFQIILVW